MERPKDLTFLEFLSSFRRGELIDRADVALAELVEAVAETGMGGALTITLPVKVNKAGQLEITPKMEVKKPRPALGTGIYYVSEDGRLTRHDPAQADWVDDLAARRRDTQEH